MLFTPAPPVFDVCFSGLTVAGAACAWSIVTARQGDPRHENFHRLLGAVSCCAVAYYAALYLAWGMGGAGKLLTFLVAVNDGRHSWTVWLTLLMGTCLALYGGFRFLGLIGRPLGQRIGLPVGKYAILGAAFGACWYFDLFFPVSRTDWLLWTFAQVANFVLHVIYLDAVTEGIAALLLWCKPNNGAAGLAGGELKRRTFTMRPARGN